MGQYFYLMNLTKKEWVHAHEIGNGLKHGEQTGWKYSTEQVAKMLVAPKPEAAHPLIGTWHGDSIAFVGDYGDVHSVCGLPAPDLITEEAERMHNRRDDDGDADDWVNISAQVREMMTAVFGISYEGDGWLRIKEPGNSGDARPNMTPDLILSM